MKSKITRLAYTEVRSIGRYETCRVEAEATVDPADRPGDVMRRLKKWVAFHVDEGPAEEVEDE